VSPELTPLTVIVGVETEPGLELGEFKDNDEGDDGAVVSTSKLKDAVEQSDKEDPEF
jgi:hypothetical protein